MTGEAIYSSDGKEEFRLSQEFLDETHEQMSKWYWFLNTTIGGVSIAFAQASLGSSHPPLNACISIIWVTLLYLGSLKYFFPKNLEILRKHRGRSVIFIRKYIERKYLGGVSLFKKIPFFALGYSYLVFVVLLWFEDVQTIKLAGAFFRSVFLPDTCTCIPGL